MKGIDLKSKVKTQLKAIFSDRRTGNKERDFIERVLREQTVTDRETAVILITLTIRCLSELRVSFGDAEVFDILGNLSKKKIHR